MATKMKRKKRIAKSCANPLFIKWVEELRDNAKEKGFQSQYTFSKALNSLRKYPLPLGSGEEAMVLDHIGMKLANILDRKLMEYQKEGVLEKSSCARSTPSGARSTSFGTRSTSSGTRSTSSSARSTSSGARTSTPPVSSSPVRAVMRKSPMVSIPRTYATCGKKQAHISSVSISNTMSKHKEAPPTKKAREYIPAYRSGAYALIIGLYMASQKTTWKGYLYKAELQQEAQPYSAESFTLVNPGNYYNAWRSMSTLIKKALVLKKSSPAKFCLTDQGEGLAVKLIDANPEIASFLSGEDAVPISEDQEVLSSVEQSSDVLKQSSDASDVLVVQEESELTKADFQLLPGDFEVVLLVDCSESTASRKVNSQYNGILLQELGKNGISFDVRKLNVGDFAWIARKKAVLDSGEFTTSPCQEALLDYLIERKRYDDLAGSILDGRFNEQKFRLKKSGVSNLIYLVEEHGGVSHSILDDSALNQAITNTQVQDGFFVKWVKDICGTVSYLSFMTRALQNIYLSKTIQVYSKESMSESSRSSQNKGLEKIVECMSFSSFNEGSLKNKVQSVQEVFVHHLMVIPGISADKASVLINRYPTPSHLQKDYLNGIIEDEKIKQIEDLRSGIANRRFGRSLGELFYTLYGK